MNVFSACNAISYMAPTCTIDIYWSSTLLSPTENNAGIMHVVFRIIIVSPNISVANIPLASIIHWNNTAPI